MAIIQSGDSDDTLTIDPAANAARVVLYDAAGNQIDQVADGAYCTHLEVVPTVITLGTVYFAMRNTSTKTAKIKRIELAMNFSGTAAATRSIFSLCRFSAATPTGGTPQTAVKKKQTDPASSMGDIRAAPGGLTITGITQDSPYHLFSLQNQLNATIAQSLIFQEPIVIVPGDGILIKAHTAVVAGVAITGSINWTEHV